VVNQDVVKYAARAVVRYLDGNLDEYKRLTDMAMSFHTKEPELMDCRYKVNGQWVKAKINWNTGEIFDMSGGLVRKGLRA
jgi:hypothetical protein